MTSSNIAQISVWAKGKFEGVAPWWLSCNNDGQGGHDPANWIFPNTDCAIAESNLRLITFNLDPIKIFLFTNQRHNKELT